MRKLRILLIPCVMKIGGEETFSLTLAKELARRKHTVYAAGTMGPMVQEFESNDIRVFTGPFAKRTVLGVIRGAIFLRQLILKKNVDIIHAQSVVPALTGFLAAKCITARKRPIVIWHDHGIKYYRLVAPIYNFIPGLVIANSRFEMNKLNANGLSMSKLRVVQNCLTVEFPEKINSSKEIHDELGINNNLKLLGTVSRLAEHKGHRYFLEAAKKILNERNDVRFIVVGDGPLSDDLKMQRDRLGIKKEVFFLGFRRDLEKIYRSIDILIFPSIFEPFGVVALEAAAFGKPVIGSNVDGIKESVADGETGILVPPRDSNELYRAMIALLDNEEMAKTLGRNGRKRIQEHFTAERLGNEIESIYYELMIQRGLLRC